MLQNFSKWIMEHRDVDKMLVALIVSTAVDDLVAGINGSTIGPIITRIFGDTDSPLDIFGIKFVPSVFIKGFMKFVVGLLFAYYTSTALIHFTKTKKKID